MTCSEVFAIIGLIGGILNVISAAFDQLLYLYICYIVPYAAKIGHVGFLVVSIVISVVWMIPDACLLYGISKKKPGFMMVWLVIKMIFLVVSC